MLILTYCMIQVRREKEAFENLIREKASLMMPSAVVSLAAEAQATSAAEREAHALSAPRDARQGGQVSRRFRLKAG